jgi:hypothetical protein
MKIRKETMFVMAIDKNVGSLLTGRTSLTANNGESMNGEKNRRNPQKVSEIALTI